MPRGKPQSAACGTCSGYNRHYRNGEDPCDECRAANTAYSRERRGCQPFRPAKCGTRSGYHRHRTLDQPACPDCLAAEAAHQRAVRAARKAA